MKKVGSILLAAVLSLGFVGCGGQVVNPGESGGVALDPNKDTMYISVFNGGYGHEWLKTIVNDYNAARPDNKYNIGIKANKDEFSTISAQVEAGTFTSDIFFSNLYIYKLINTNSLENIADVWDSQPDNDGDTVRSLMFTADEYAAAYGDGKGGLYGLPLQESVRTFVYDHDLFLTYGLLYDDQGNFTNSEAAVSKGNDGIKGTYDDGHPQTEAQWDAMVKKADSIYGNAFSYTGKFGIYVNDLYYSIAAQYDGLDKFMLNYTFDTNTTLGYDFGDGNGETIINLDNAYKLAEMKGRTKGLQFMDQYLACKDVTIGTNSPYVYSIAGTLGYSHTDAQNDFILNTARDNPQKIAMLFEGDWWENEAKTTFKALEDAKYDDYAFRTRNYRFMTLPYFEGQAEARNVKTYSVADNMYIAAVKQTDATKKEIVHDFLKFMYQKKYIQNFTVESGGVMPFNVDLTTEQKAKLSPFTKNFLELYHDRTNNKFFNTQIFWNTYDTHKCGAFPAMNSTDGYYQLINALYYADAATLQNEMIASWNDNYAGKVATYQNYIANK